METRRSLQVVTTLTLLLLGAAPSARADLIATLAEDQGRQADMLVVQSRFREAIPKYREWLKTHPEDASSFNRLGLSLQKTGQAKEARHAYERATKIDRCFAEAWNNLGTLDHVRGKCKRAISAYRKAVACKPDSAVFQRNLGTAYLELGDVVRSARAYGEALRLDPSVLDLVAGYGVSVNGDHLAKRFFEVAKDCARRDELETAVQLLNRARVLGLEDFARTVAGERAFAKLLADPRYAEQLLR
jgi:Flp pilus assembly protein TadD